MPDGPTEAKQATAQAEKQLVRGLGLIEATALNMIDMVGIGPFITIPLILAEMGGPQAMLGWMLGALLALSDGMVWSQLGTAMPHAGGTYVFLREAFGPRRWGRLLSFLFIWQMIFRAPLSMASGLIGFSSYAEYLFPQLSSADGGRNFDHRILSAAVGVFIIFLLYRRITTIGKISIYLWVVVMGTIAWVIYGGITNFNLANVLAFPPGAFNLSEWVFWVGLGGATTFAIYDYLGYQNVCYLGGEIKDPERVIPRALIYSILTIAALPNVANRALKVLAFDSGGDPVVSSQTLAAMEAGSTDAAASATPAATAETNAATAATTPRPPRRMLPPAPPPPPTPRPPSARRSRSTTARRWPIPAPAASALIMPRPQASPPSPSMPRAPIPAIPISAITSPLGTTAPTIPPDILFSGNRAHRRLMRYSRLQGPSPTTPDGFRSRCRMSPATEFGRPATPSTFNSFGPAMRGGATYWPPTTCPMWPAQRLRGQISALEPGTLPYSPPSTLAMRTWTPTTRRRGRRLSPSLHLGT